MAEAPRDLKGGRGPPARSWVRGAGGGGAPTAGGDPGGLIAELCLCYCSGPTVLKRPMLSNLGQACALRREVTASMSILLFAFVRTKSVSHFIPTPAPIGRPRSLPQKAWTHRLGDVRRRSERNNLFSHIS